MTEMQSIIDRATAALRDVRGLRAVVLGGSRASGKHRPDSDTDIGIYYSESNPPDIHDVRAAARELSNGGECTVTELYQWGPWVNGGAWIETDTGRVDFLYRNIDQVARTIDEAQRGVIHHDFAQQGPTGFWGVTYLAETSVCKPLHDPDRIVADLKSRVATYPPKLKESIVINWLWSAEFTLYGVRKHAGLGDVYGCVCGMTRMFMYLTQVLYALNETYFMNDKTVPRDINSFTKAPGDYVSRVSSILGCPGISGEQLQRCAEQCAAIWFEVKALASDYRPKFDIHTQPPRV